MIEDLDLLTPHKEGTFVSDTMLVNVHTGPDANSIIDVVFAVNMGMVHTIVGECWTGMTTMTSKTETGIETTVTRTKEKISTMEEVRQVKW